MEVRGLSGGDKDSMVFREEFLFNFVKFFIKYIEIIIGFNVFVIYFESIVFEKCY